MDASLCYLLRTVLSKSEKDQLRAAHTSFDEIKDVGKLLKHLVQVLERISKTGGDVQGEPSHFPIDESKIKLFNYL